MAGAAGLAAILLGAMAGFVCAVIAIALALYGFRTSKPRRGFIASMSALVLSLLSVLLSVPIWSVLLSGRDTHGEPLNYSEMGPAVFLIAIETLAALTAIFCVARRRSRRVS